MEIVLFIVFISVVAVFWAIVWPILRCLDKHDAAKDAVTARDAQIAAEQDLIAEVECAEGGEVAWEQLKAAGMQVLHILGKRSITLTFNSSTITLAKRKRDL